LRIHLARFRPHRPHLPVLMASALVLSACAGQGTGTTPVSTLGADDGTDACRPQVEQFDRDAAFFAGPIFAGAAVIGAGGVLGSRPGLIGGLVWAASSAVAAAATASYIEERQRQAAGDAAALTTAVASDIEQENTNLAQTQRALDSVTDCRLREARRVQEAARAGEIQRQEAAARLAALRQQAERDLALSQQVQQRIQARTAEIGTGLDVVVPGARTAPPPPPPRVAARPAQPVRLQAAPLPAAAPVAELPARQPVQVVPTRNPEFVAVETPAGERLGYASAAVFTIPPAQTRAVSMPAAAGTADAARLRTLVATNIARRENFTASVNDLQRAVTTGGFELGT
jgi:Skp family chaperone for outer membrane proteins